MTQPPPPPRDSVSRSEFYLGLTSVYCLMLIVLTQVPWPVNPLRRVVIDIIGLGLLALAVASFVRARRASASDRISPP